MIAVIVMAFSGIAQTIPTKEEFIAACDSLEIYHPYVVYAQARLESGNFKSTTYKKKNNCLGIYDSRKKCYATYNNWKECLAAYKNKVQYKWIYKECSDEEYLNWIISMGYASDTLYKAKVMKILNNVKK